MVWLCGALSSAVPQAAAALPEPPPLRRMALEIGDYRGISDLTRDAQGQFWAIPERQRALLRLRLGGPKPGLEATPVPVRGISADTDFESLIALPDGRFVAGTETQRSKRSSDTLCLLRIDDGVAHVTEKFELPYRLWEGLRAHANEGIEGLCAVDNLLFAAVETAHLSPQGQRYAPLGRYDLARRSWEPWGILLTSRIGKISGITCRAAPDDPKSIEMLAIERHFGVSRLLRVRLPRARTGRGPPTLLTPEVVVDFTSCWAWVPNFEGLAFGDGGDLYVISDNDFGRVSGPTQVVVVPAARLARP